MQLQYILHKEIDFNKWDNALSKCVNKLIYAESIYLNTMAGTWDAIVSDDWSCIMPVPVKKKWGIKYAPTVPYLQQLGVFSCNDIAQIDIENFYNFLQQKIKLADICWNYKNEIKIGVLKNNFVLHLSSTHNDLKKNYKKDLQYDLRRNINYKIVHNLDIATMVLLLQKEYQHRIKHVKQADFNNLITLAKLYLKQNKTICKAIEINSEIVAAVLLWKDENRIYNIASVITNNGKTHFANHFLYNAILNEYENSNLIFDFEGSDIEGIAHFYQKFGAINEPYFFTHFNYLPFLIKLVKK